jgi:hypothetical protein
MKCPSGKRAAEKFYEDHIDEYDKARDDAFNEEFRDYLKDIKFDKNVIVTVEDIEGFVESFSFPDESEWITNEFESFVGECADRAYDEWKDERAGLC